MGIVAALPVLCISLFALFGLPFLGALMFANDKTSFFTAMFLNPVSWISMFFGALFFLSVITLATAPLMVMDCNTGSIVDNESFYGIPSFGSTFGGVRHEYELCGPGVYSLQIITRNKGEQLEAFKAVVSPYGKDKFGNWMYDQPQSWQYNGFATADDARNVNTSFSIPDGSIIQSFFITGTSRDSYVEIRKVV